MAREGYTDFTEKCTKWASSVNAGKSWQTCEAHSEFCTCVVRGLRDAVMGFVKVKAVCRVGVQMCEALGVRHFSKYLAERT